MGVFQGFFKKNKIIFCKILDFEIENRKEKIIPIMEVRENKRVREIAFSGGARKFEGVKI